MKKNMLTMLSISIAAALLGGCAGEDEVVYLPDEAITEVVIGEEKKTEEETERGGMEVESDTETETEPYNEADNKTDNTAYFGNTLLEEHMDALKEFSYTLFAENMDTENPVLSPVSAYIALSMAGLGAENNTKAEFETVLGDEADMTYICSQLMDKLPTASENNTVTLACSAWVDDEMNVLDSWLSDIDTVMHSEVFHTDLSDEMVVTQINDWIDDKTNGLIEQMIDKPFEKDTRLVLFNTVYFKAKWASSFDSAYTYTDKFYLENGGELSTEMMHKSEVYMDYLSNDFAEGLIFPYQNWDEGDGNFALVALKPVDGMTIREAYSKLTNKVIGDLLENKQTVLVNTKLPKFEITFDKSLNESLKSMSLIDAFDEETADFGGIGKTLLDNGVYIDLVRQKVKIIVDEEGTEAAAVTEIAMLDRCALIEETPLNVYFDSPFLYIIMDMDSEIPLFVGIMDSPGVSD